MNQILSQILDLSPPLKNPLHSFMASDLEAKSKEKFIDDNSELVVKLYTQAITLSPENAEYYVDRAQANIKLGLYTGTAFCPSNFLFPYASSL